MSTPNPALVAAAPELKLALTNLKAMLATILTGDPVLAPARAVPAANIFVNQLALIWPELAVAEEGVLLQQGSAGIDSLIAKIDAITAAKA